MLLYVRIATIGGMAVELRQFRYFLAVAREGTFGRAAQVLHVAQPALSRQIRKLELELGVDLFVRHAHGVTMTPAAQSLSDRFERVLREVSDIEQSAGLHARSLSGCVRIGVSPGTAEILAYPLSRLVAARQPGLRCQFVSMLMPARADLLRDGQMDLAVMNHPRLTEGLQILPVMREPLCLLHRPDDRRFGPGPLEISDLVDVPLVLGGETNSGIRASLQEAFAAARLPLTLAAEANTAGACKALVREGMGPTVHVAAMARGELQRGELCAVPIRNLHSIRVIALPLARQGGRETRLTVRLVHDCLSALVRRGDWPGGQILPLEERVAVEA